MPWLDYRTHSEIGLVRKNNQDSGYASPDMLLVADGMGGAAAGDLASSVAVEEMRLADELQRANAATGEEPLHGEKMLDVLEVALAKANDRLADLVAQDHDLEGMGTTVCGGFFDGEQMGLIHIGDSRGYCMRDGELVRLTRDHSWVQSLVDEGKLTEEEALYHPHRSLLLRVLNGQPTNVPDLLLVDVRPGDRLLFCSDGLCGLVEDGPIQEALRLESLDEAITQLISLAHDGGGLDNLTLVLADVKNGEPTIVLEPVVIGAGAETTIPEITMPVIDLSSDDEEEPKHVNSCGQAVPVAPPPDRDARPAGSAIIASVLNDEVPTSPTTPTDPPRREGTGAKTVTLVADEEDARYRPVPPPKRRSWRIWLVLGLVLAGLIAAGVGVDRLLRAQYYVGDDDTHVVLYNGVPDGIGILHLSQPAKTTDIELRYLPQRLQSEVRKHSLRFWSSSEADNTLTYLADEAKRCKELREMRSPSPSPTPTPMTISSSGSPTGSSAGPSASTSPTAETSSALVPSGSPTPSPQSGC